MAFSKAQYELAKDRLRGEVNQLVRAEENKAGDAQEAGYKGLLKAARAGDAAGVRKCIDVDAIIRMVKRSQFHPGTEIREFVTGAAEESKQRTAEIAKYSKTLIKIVDDYCDSYLTTGVIPNVPMAIAELNATKKP